MSRFDSAKQMYQNIGVNVEGALEKLANVKISMHCWQGDDVAGFEHGASLDGGIAATGNYQGKARNYRELMADMDQAFTLIPGKHKINLHASYAITDEKMDRDKLEPKHFIKWIEYAKERGLGIDFNPTLFSHPKAADGLTLSNPDKKIRQFWINHLRRPEKLPNILVKNLAVPV